jgi:amidase
VKRREFLKLAAVGAFAAAIPGAVARPPETTLLRGHPSQAGSFEFEEATLSGLDTAMERGRLTALSLTRSYLARIEEVDRRGPTLRSVLEINPDALALARELDRERKTSGPRGPLHGIPVLLKDNLDIHDRMTTTAGSLALAGSVPAQDSFVARRLRQAGAVILGKTNLSEWANFRSSHSTSGWSGRGGLTRNPYALDRNPSGSSSGSAVAVAANLCAVAVGTETDGSILSPASYNGLVGIKPTVGRNRPRASACRAEPEITKCPPPSQPPGATASTVVGRPGARRVGSGQRRLGEDRLWSGIVSRLAANSRPRSTQAGGPARCWSPPGHRSGLRAASLPGADTADG